MSTSPPTGPRATVVQLVRFTRAERWLHRTTAALVAICVVTAALLYVPALATLVGRRALVETVHVVAGLLLPVPLLLSLVSAAVRLDLGRLNRFAPDDWTWLRSRTRRSGAIKVGKFNAGQKLNAAFTAGALLVLLGTGLLMRFPTLAPVVYRTGATFVHDWIALAVVVVAAGHLGYAWRDPVARAGMRTGRVPLWWARRDHAAWADEQVGDEQRLDEQVGDEQRADGQRR